MKENRMDQIHPVSKVSQLGVKHLGNSYTIVAML